MSGHRKQRSGVPGQRVRIAGQRRGGRGRACTESSWSSNSLISPSASSGATLTGTFSPGGYLRRSNSFSSSVVFCSSGTGGVDEHEPARQSLTSRSVPQLRTSWSWKRLYLGGEQRPPSAVRRRRAAKSQRPPTYCAALTQ